MRSGSPIAPDIHAYHDYRVFLKDWFAYLEATVPGYSLRRVARDAKIAVGYLPMVLAGRRSLSKPMFDKIAPHLKLNAADRSQLELLRDLAEAPTPEARSAVLARLQRKPSYKDAHPKEFETVRYLSSWYYVAIRELAAVKGFSLDPRWIQARLRAKVPLADVSKAVEFLRANEFIRVEKGKVRFTEKNLRCMGGVFKVALGAFHKEMLGLTADAIDTVSGDDRHILGHTFAIPIEKLGEVKAILDGALKQIEELGVDQKSSDTVFHVTLAAIPLSKVKKESE